MALALALGTLGSPAARAFTSSVTVAGSLQSELGCPGDYQPDCPATFLVYDAADDAWQGVFQVPAGTWYKAALNGTWDENYGADATPNGPNLELALPAPRNVKFYFDDGSNWVTDDLGSVIAVVPGSFQSELGCPSDWDPGCLRSWLRDPDGDGTYGFSALLPAGDYEGKVAIGESWDENYGESGVPNGPNLSFSTAGTYPTSFEYDATTHVLTIVTLPESGLDRVGLGAGLLLLGARRRGR
jgi:hypothetical protein